MKYMHTNYILILTNLMKNLGKSCGKYYGVHSSFYSD